MTKRTAKRKPPEIVYIREVSQNPGSPEELEKILWRWDLALARKAKRILESEQQAKAE